LARLIDTLNQFVNTKCSIHFKIICNKKYFFHEFCFTSVYIFVVGVSHVKDQDTLLLYLVLPLLYYSFKYLFVKCIQRKVNMRLVFWWLRC